MCIKWTTFVASWVYLFLHCVAKRKYPLMNIKNSVLTVLFILFVITLSAQKSCIPANQLPASTPAFREMMAGYFGYTVTGNNTPASGVILQTNKPSATLSGNVLTGKSKNFTLNLQVTGGADGNAGSLFSGSRINGFFKAAPGLNILLGYGKGTYANKAGEECLSFKRDIKIITAHKDLLFLQADTASVVRCFFLDSLPPAFDDFVQLVKAKTLLCKFDNYKRDTGIYNDEYYKNLIMAMMMKYGEDAALPSNIMYTELKEKLAAPLTFVEIEKLVADFQRLKLVPMQMADMQNTYANNMLKDFWVRKTIAWFNITPSISNTGVTLFDTVKKKLNDTTSLTYGIQASFNTMIKYKSGGRFIYWKIGAEFGHMDNLDELLRFNYQLQSSLSTNGLVSSTKAGSAYRGRMAHGNGEGVFTSLYHVPFVESFMPGYYINVAYRHNDAWISKDRVTAEAGLLWNVNNSTGTHNILSIMPYVGWLNLMKEYNDVLKHYAKPLSDLFYFNIKVGVPINFGKQ